MPLYQGYLNWRPLEKSANNNNSYSIAYYALAALNPYNKLVRKILSPFSRLGIEDQRM